MIDFYNFCLNKEKLKLQTKSKIKNFWIKFQNIIEKKYN